MQRLILALFLILAPMQASALVLAEEGRALAATVMDGHAVCHDKGNGGATQHRPVHGGAGHGGAGCVASCMLAGASTVAADGQAGPAAESAQRHLRRPARAPAALSWPPPCKPPRV